jgi:hypothetical protein
MKRRGKSIQIVMRKSRHSISNRNIYKNIHYGSKEAISPIGDYNADKKYVLDEDEIYRFGCMIDDLITKNAKVNINANEYSLYYTDTTGNNSIEVGVSLYLYERTDGNIRFYGYDGKNRLESSFNGFINDISVYKEKMLKYADAFYTMEKERMFNTMEDILGIQLETILRKSEL